MSGQARERSQTPAGRTLSLRVLSILLRYPDEDLCNAQEEIAAVAAQLQPREVQSAVRMFSEALRRQPLIRNQEKYTAVFDMDPAATMNMTYHIHGDNEKRAQALARLEHTYGQAGWQRATGELPDYLPLMLEFLAVCEHPAHAGVVWECLQGLGAMVAHLEKKAPTYAALLRPVIRMADAWRGSKANVPGPAENNLDPQETRP